MILGFMIFQIKLKIIDEFFVLYIGDYSPKNFTFNNNFFKKIKKILKPWLAKKTKKINSTTINIYVNKKSLKIRIKSNYKLLFTKNISKVNLNLKSLLNITLGSILMAVSIRLSQTGGFILHASACLFKNKALVFVGKSGAGKSTIKDLLSSSLKPLSDDVVFIKPKKNKYYLYQPFHQIMKDKKIKYTNKKFSLGKIFFLVKSNKRSKIIMIKNKEKIFRKISSEMWLPGESIKKNYWIKFYEFISNFRDFFEINFRKKRNELITLFNKKN